MTYEMAEIEDIIISYLGKIYPLSLIASDPVEVLAQKIAVRISKAQVQRALDSLKTSECITSYKSDILKLEEVKLTELGNLVYLDIEEGHILPKSSEEDDYDYPGNITRIKEQYGAPIEHEEFFITKALEGSIKETEKRVDITVKKAEKRIDSRMMELFAIMSAVFALLISAFQFNASLPKNIALSELVKFSWAFFGPVAFILVVLLVVARLLPKWF